MLEPSDGSLLEAHRRGDPRAFSELVRRHEHALLSHARALLGRGAGHEDAVQEAFLRLAQTPPALPAGVRGDPGAERAHLGAWLSTVTRNLCMDTLRSETRRRRREAAAAETEGGGDAGLARVEEQDTRDAVRRELEQLPADQREVLVLRLVGDRSYKEIAAITGRKIGTVGWLISVGLQQLAERLGPVVAVDSARTAGAAPSVSSGTTRGGAR
ncbi:MAG: sigma-70 family RNA polymerase sigma factor [Planctomycetes bacterium]|nr:sigma-70 family RNA polymerase sigma factor [Planctomycetota bacterium]